MQVQYELQYEALDETKLSVLVRVCVTYVQDKYVTPCWGYLNKFTRVNVQFFTVKSDFFSVGKTYALSFFSHISDIFLSRKQPIQNYSRRTICILLAPYRKAFVRVQILRAVAKSEKSWYKKKCHVETIGNKTFLFQSLSFFVDPAEEAKAKNQHHNFQDTYNSKLIH